MIIMNDIDVIYDRLEDIEERVFAIENPTQLQSTKLINNLEQDVVYWRGKADEYLVILTKLGHKFE